MYEIFSMTDPLESFQLVIFSAAFCNALSISEVQHNTESDLGTSPWLCGVGDCGIFQVIVCSFKMPGQ